MKQLRRFLFLTMATLVVASCSENLTENQGDDSLKNSRLKCIGFCKTQDCALWAGQNINAGGITIGNDETKFYIALRSDNGFQMNVTEQVKIWVGTSMPFDKRPPAGSFPYKYTVTAADGNIFWAEISLTDIPDYVCGETLYVIIHADVLAYNKGTIKAETAFGGCDQGLGKAWWYYTAHETACCE